MAKKLLTILLILVLNSIPFIVGSIYGSSVFRDLYSKHTSAVDKTGMGFAVVSAVLFAYCFAYIIIFIIMAVMRKFKLLLVSLVIAIGIPALWIIYLLFIYPI